MEVQNHSTNTLQLQSQQEQDELFQIMKARMNSEQEQMFMISHYLYLQHGTDNTKFVVDFDNVWKNVDLSRRDNAKRILVKNFTEHNDYQIVSLPKEEMLHNAANGRPKETIYLTVDCFKNFCMIAATPKAKTVRSYYIKMENIMHEYYKNFKIKNAELQNSLQLSKQSLQISQKETALKRHEVLIESNKNKWVVYFCKIQQYEDGSFILKIGETVDIKHRMEALRSDFGTHITVLDVFVCENSIKFEKSLHNSNELVKYKYNKLENKNKKFSTEAYLIPNQKEYEKIVKFATIELNKYNNIEFMKLRLEEKKIDLFATLVSHCKNYDEIMNILTKLGSSLSVINELQLDTNKEQISEVNRQIEYHNIESFITMESENVEETTEEQKNTEKIIPKITANATGPIVQTYHKDDLQNVVQVYNSIMEATRDFNYNNKTASFTAIKKAYQYKTIYLDYRWHFISNRQEPDLHKPREIGETVITNERNQGQIAMLNIDKTKILKVFKIAKDAAKEILQHPSAMCMAIKHSTPLNNHYWLHWENVNVLLQNEFLQTNNLPTKHKNVRGIKIKQIHPITNEIVKVFLSYTDIQKELKISVKKIKELIENNEIYKGKYKFTRV